MSNQTLRARATRYRDLVISLAWEDLKVRYKSPALGFVWSLVMPLVLVVIFSFVFTKIIPVGLEPFPLFLLIGLFPWNFLALCVSTGTTALVADGPLIKNVAFPRLAIPLAILVTQLVHFLLALLLLLAACPWFGVRWTWAWLGLPILVAMQSLFVLGVTLTCGALHVYYRDMKYVVEVGLVAWFYLTPIFYSPTMVPQSWQTLFLLNPMAAIVTLYRALLLGDASAWGGLAWYAAAASVGSCVAGVALFRRLSARFADLV